MTKSDAQEIKGPGKNLEVVFEGKWDWDKNDQGNRFFLSIEKSGGGLVGLYSRVAGGGEREDGPFDHNPSFEIQNVKGNISEIRFTHYASGKKGKIRLTVNGDTLLWEVLEKPDSALYILPDRAILKRRK